METKKPLLLIAEDDLDDQFLIQDIIQNSCLDELELVFLNDGVELLDYLEHEINRSNKPSLVMLDLNMPRKDGRTALREIKSDPRLSGIPVVILTTSRVEEDFNFCEDFGVAGFYRKPSSIAEYRRIISNLCQQYLVEA